MEKVLPRKILKPTTQKQNLFNIMVETFEEKVIEFSHSECADRIKHRVTGSATQLLYDLTDIILKIGNCKKQLSGRQLWHKIPTELQALMQFEVKSKEFIQMSQRSTREFATRIRDVADKAVMAKEKLGSLRVSLLQAAEVFIEYSTWLESLASKYRVKTATQKQSGTAAEAVIKQVAEREKVSLINLGNKPLTHPVAIQCISDRTRGANAVQWVNYNYKMNIS